MTKVNVAALQALERAAAEATSWPVSETSLLRPADIALMIPMRNALPPLLAVAVALREWKQDMLVYDAESQRGQYDGNLDALLERSQQVQDKLDAAVALLDAFDWEGKLRKLGGASCACDPKLGPCIKHQQRGELK